MAALPFFGQEKPEGPKPDFGIFGVILGAVGVAVPFILQSWGVVDMSWWFSALIYFAAIIFEGWSLWTHATPHFKTSLRVILALCWFSLLGSLGAYGTFKQYRKEHLPPPPPDRKIVRWLSPGINIYRPFVVCFGGHFSKHSEFNGSEFLYAGSRVQLDPAGMGRRDGVAVSVTNGQMRSWPALVVRSIGNKACIDVHIPTLNTPIDIEKGESTPLPENWDWNSNSTSMEIVDDQRRVIFQEEYIPDNLIIIRGYIQFENITLEAGPEGWPDEIAHIMTGASLDLRPIFLYPKEKHSGETNPYYAP